MNKDTFKGSWNEIKGKVKEKWGKLTDNDLTEINGKREQLLGKLQKNYGYAKDRAEKELNAFEKSMRKNKDDFESFEDEDTISSYDEDVAKKNRKKAA